MNPNPAKALSGTRTSHICDSCNRRLGTGDLARAYATHYEEGGWAIIEAVFWKHRLVSVEERDRSLPTEGETV